MRRLQVLTILLLILPLLGCGFSRQGRSLSIAAPDFFGLGEELAVQLSTGMRQPLGGGGRLILATMVNLDDLYGTSRFGRTLTESLATRLFRHGFGVIEVRKAADLLVKGKTGELILSRDTKLLAGQHDAVAVVTGTYSLTPETVIVNARLIDAGSNNVLSVAGLEIQRSRAINAMLAGATSRGRADGKSFDLSAYEQ